VIDGFSRRPPDRGLDLVGDMRDDLDRGAQEVAPPFPIDDRLGGPGCTSLSQGWIEHIPLSG